MADNLKFTVIYSNTYDDSDFNQHHKTFNITIQEREKHKKYSHVKTNTTHA